ncbi:MAG: type I 3-dehydroquinate dehydratase [Proteobacteria bacterium]|jgi:3-dehydroquinate dehydratase-1/3-dehydroquinate dehydratase/shikimate dehydrogenase|nr:type I 3-dehydroquinate dehydratase [Desulfocapsa sp.]MBU3946481.1 type I 3-dehydroquinate dehydratase [Pseudomonadota bacterium]MCG2743032.1 type I 3-dehydroquinate dehydratase [Desulfobacteraceae bacterium]MBU3983280.1 type I 3-dehydroquinate dehydratase [Pseudomonadota bacterium]MBU4028325.1 type I 3-dehydroquinate dehydratase [Pseudomonadota bacterium]
MIRICVSIARETVGEGLAVAESISSLADVIEIRLDRLKTISVAPFISQLSKPLLLTNRPIWEGGGFAGDEELRIAPLLEGVQQGVSYVDLELKAPTSSHKALLEEVENSPSRLILSWHNFQETPTKAELVGRLAMIQDKGAHIAKIVTMAHDYHDVLRVLNLQEEAARMDIPLIAFCMGRPGVVSRVATVELGGYMTYCAAHEDEATAPGQLSVEVLRQIEALMINGKESH